MSFHLHIAVCGAVLLLFLCDGEVAAASDENGGASGLDGVVGIEVLCELAGVGAEKAVHAVVVHGVDAALLAVREVCGPVNLDAVACGRAALYIVAKAVHALGLPGSRLADGVVHGRLPSRLELVGVGLLCGELVFVVEPAPNVAEVVDVGSVAAVIPEGCRAARVSSGCDGALRGIIAVHGSMSPF